MTYRYRLGDRRRRDLHRRDPDRRGERRDPYREGAVHARGSLRGLPRGRPAHPPRGGHRGGGGGLSRARHHGGHQRHHRGEAGPAGFLTTEGFRDMLEIQRQIRPSLYDSAVREAASPRPPLPVLRDPGAAGCRRCGAGAAGRAGGGRRGRATEGRGRGGDRGVLSPRLPRSGARAAHARDRAGGLSGSGGLPLLGGGAGVPGVLPGQHHPDQRRRAGPSSSGISPTSGSGCGMRAFRGNCWSCRAAAAS